MSVEFLERLFWIIAAAAITGAIGLIYKQIIRAATDLSQIKTALVAVVTVLRVRGLIKSADLRGLDLK